MALDPNAPVGAFGATINGVAWLVPEATLRDGSIPAPTGVYGVTYEAVHAWIVEVSGMTELVLDGWQGLPTTPREPETTSDRDQFISAVRTIVHNGAASYLEAARHPERANVNTESYAAVLWNRYTVELDRLADWLRAKLANTGTGPDESTGDNGGLGYGFPPPLFGDLVRF